MPFKNLKTFIWFMFILLTIGGCDFFHNSNGSPIKTGSLEDMEGNVYKTVILGNQEWTVENLRTTKYNDGKRIPLIKEDSAWVASYNDKQPGYCYYLNNEDSDHTNKYGALYNWHAVKSGKLAPKGWRIPTDSDWTELAEYLIKQGYNWDGSKEENKIAKALAAKTDWKSDDSLGSIGNKLNKNNSTGFSALPGGVRIDNGSFGNLGNGGYWWSSTEKDTDNAWYRSLSYKRDYLVRNDGRKGLGFSVWLLRDL